MQRIGSYQGFVRAVASWFWKMLRGGYGYKASGNTACPTSLFMLDSWVAFR